MLTWQTVCTVDRIDADVADKLILKSFNQHYKNNTSAIIFFFIKPLDHVIK